MAVAEREPNAEDTLGEELEGLDALDLGDTVPRSRLSSAWATTWPKVAAVALFFGAWQLVVWSGWRPEYILPSPFTALEALWHELGQAETWKAIGITLRRAASGYALAVIVGVTVGAVVAQFRSMRVAVGSMITGLQTMPSIAWFPLAIVLFKLSESAILFVVVLGAAPSVANGLIAGVDTVPPILTRAGRVLGARRLTMWRHVILPAALPTFVAGLKQGWAFAWRSLMAGELIVIIGSKPSIGSRLDFARTLSDYPLMVSIMMMIFIIGVVVDGAIFGTVDRIVRQRRGLTGREAR